MCPTIPPLSPFSFLLPIDTKEVLIKHFLSYSLAPITSKCQVDTVNFDGTAYFKPEQWTAPIPDKSWNINNPNALIRELTLNHLDKASNAPPRKQEMPFGNVQGSRDRTPSTDSSLHSKSGFEPTTSLRYGESPSREEVSPKPEPPASPKSSFEDYHFPKGMLYLTYIRKSKPS